MVQTVSRRAALAALALTAVAAATRASAQAYPSRQVRIVVPTSTGTASDLTARFVAERLSRDFGVPVVVENRSGANGILAVQNFMSTPADGHSLLVTASGLYANVSLYRTTGYDPVRDFRIVAPLNQALFVLVASPSAPFGTVAELIEHARRNPGEVTYGSAGVGSSTHLGPELFAVRAGIRLRHVPYKGGAQAVSDTAGGQVMIAMTAIPTAAALVRAGKLKALAVASTARSSVMPDVPTLAESGVANAEIVSRQGIAVPTGTPEPVVARLAQAIGRITASADYRAFLQSQGIEPEPMPAEAYAASGAEEMKRWAEMVRISGASLE